MSYYTEYTLSAKGGNINYEEVQKKLEEISGCKIKFDRNYPCKWYRHEKDMKVISKIYPDILFILEGIGEESEDMWMKYFKNGKMQVCKAEIVFPAFNEDLME